MEIPQNPRPIKRRTATIIPFPRPRAGRVDPRLGRSREQRRAIYAEARWPKPRSLDDLTDAEFEKMRAGAQYAHPLADLSEDERRALSARANWPERAGRTFRLDGEEYDRAMAGVRWGPDERTEGET